MDGHEVIAEEALLVVTDAVGLQHLLPALRARDMHDMPVSVSGVLVYVLLYHSGR